MSVFTRVSDSELTSFLALYGIASFTQLLPIEEGSDNSNFKVQTPAGNYILTLFENINKKQAAHYLEITSRLANQGLPCPRAIVSATGLVNPLNNKPAALIELLPGTTLTSMNPEQCFAVGDFLARLHQSNEHGPDNRCNPSWLMARVEKLSPKLPNAQKELLNRISHGQRLPTSLPKGLIHGDLFKDNALFINNELTGVLDFYFAFEGPNVYDLMVTVNDWCFDSEEQLNEENLKAVLQGYSQIRQLSEQEIKCMKKAAIEAAYRFWTTRLFAKYFPAKTVIAIPKDPSVFEKRIQFWETTKIDLSSMLAIRCNKSVY